MAWIKILAESEATGDLAKSLLKSANRDFGAISLWEKLVLALRFPYSQITAPP